MAGKKQQKSPAPKRLSNPISTGGGGVSYEAQVQAVYLLAMLTGAQTPVLGNGAVVGLRWQARIHGFNTDDLVCTLLEEGREPFHALIQIKRTIRALPSDKAFKDAVSGAWLDFLNPQCFRPGVDRLVVVHAGRSDESMNALEAVTRFARTSLTYDELERKATATGFASSQTRAALANIKAVLTEAAPPALDNDQVHAFLKCLWVAVHSLDIVETQELTELQARIGLVLGPRERSSAVWAELVTTCLRLNREAASLSLENLDAQLPAHLAKVFASHRNSAAASISLSAFSPATALGTRDSSRYQPEAMGVSVGLPPLASVPALAVPEMTLAYGRAGSGALITSQLDAINEKLQQCRYRDALEDISTLGRDLAPFDAHQKARWYLQRGTSYWHLGEIETAAESFLKAAELSDDDDRVVAARVRGLLLLRKVPEANEASLAARERFPDSLKVLLVHLNARLARGDELGIQDVPPAHRREPDVLQLLAWARRNTDDWKGALAYARDAIRAPGASFFARDTALSLVVGQATQDGVVSTYRLIDVDTRQLLHEVIQSFEPRGTRLWSVQSPESVSAAASHLALAYLLVGDAAGTLKVVDEASVHGVQTPALMRAELEALNQSERLTELFARGRALMTQLSADGLVVLAQAAANQGELRLVEEVLQTASSVDGRDLVETLNAIRWVALWNAKERATLKSEVVAADLAHSTSLPLISAGIRIIVQTQDEGLLNAVLARAETLAAANPKRESEMLLADLLFEAKKYVEAARHYESLLPVGHHSELHNRLLCCYVRSLQWRRAKNLIERFPSGWIEDDGARALAIELGDGVGDWDALAKLAETEFRRAPKAAGAWLLKIMTTFRTQPLAAVEAFLAEAPLDIEGSIPQLRQLAVRELRFGLRLKGMQRLYRLRRIIPSEIETASALFISFVAVTDALPHMEAELPEIAAGTSFELVDADGTRRVVTIDPLGIPGLARSGEFMDAAALDVAPFLGRVPGDVVEVAAGRRFTVVSVSSAFRRMFELTKYDMDRSLLPVPGATSISIPTTSDGGADFSQLHAQLKEISKQADQALDQYRTLPITLGIFGRLVGRSTIDVVRGWRNSTKDEGLFVCAGNEDERASAMALLETASDAAFIVDAATLAELVLVDAVAALKALPKTFVTSTTRDLARDALEKAKLERTAGVAYDNNGQLGYAEHGPADFARNIVFLQAVVDAITDHCEVVPAYGPDEVHPIITTLNKALTDEEQAVLLAATERGLRLLTVDGRLRALASHLDVVGIWPQILLMYAVNNGTVDLRTYSAAVVRMFLSNRTFVSLGNLDLLLMCHQGTAWLRLGMVKLKHYLADAGTSFHSARQVVQEFMVSLAQTETRFGAWVELLRHAFAALLHHKDCTPELKREMLVFTARLLKDETMHPYAPVADYAKQRLAFQLQYVDAKLDEAGAWAGASVFDSLVNVDVLMCGTTPWLVLGVEKDAGSRDVVNQTTETSEPSSSGAGAQAFISGSH